MRQIYVLGETTYDIIFKDNKPIDAKVGGSQLNTATSVGRMQAPVSFISQFGNDQVGDISADFIEENDISTDYIVRNKGNSRVALAFLDENNNADYTFFKSETNSSFTFPEVNKNDIVLFGSSFSIRTDIRTDLKSFLENAKRNGAIIVYDPNFRKGCPNAFDRMKCLVEENMAMATIVKGSDEDFMNIYEIDNPQAVWEQIQNLGVQALFYTANRNGVHAYWNGCNYFTDVPVVEVKSTIGAGDNFNAGLVYSLFKQKVYKKDLTSLTKTQITEICTRAIAFAQEVCQSYDNYISEGFAKKMLKRKF